jgi:hypothetical protein
VEITQNVHTALDHPDENSILEFIVGVELFPMGRYPFLHRKRHIAKPAVGTEGGNA